MATKRPIQNGQIRVEQVVLLAEVPDPMAAFAEVCDVIAGDGTDTQAEFRFDYKGIRHTVIAEVIGG